LTHPGSDIFIIFDLDDTLIAERDFLLSGYRAIARKLYREIGSDEELTYGIMADAPSGSAAFDRAIAATGGRRDISWMLDIYRTHLPVLNPLPGVDDTLRELRRRGVGMGILTEGRHTTQLHKIIASGLLRYMTAPPMVVAPASREGVAGKDFACYVARNGIKARHLIAVGDNPAKDFAQPNTLGWLTVAIAARSCNIHPQHWSSFPVVNSPRLIIDSIIRLPGLIL